MADSLEINEQGQITRISARPRNQTHLDAVTYMSDFFLVQRELSKAAGPIDLYLQDGVPSVVCMYQDNKSKATSWKLENNTKVSFAASLKGAIAFGSIDNKAYAYDYPCNQTAL